MTQSQKPAAASPSALSAEELYAIESTGHRLLERGRLEQAQQLFSGLGALHPSSWYAFFGLGEVARQRGELSHAASYYKHAEQLAQGPEGAEAALALAQVYMTLKSANEARSALARVIQGTDPEDRIHGRARALMSRLL